MLLRAYRLTDKFGLLLVKLTAAAGEQAARGIAALLFIVRRILVGLLGVLVLLLGTVGRLLRSALQLFGVILGAIVGLLVSGSRVVGRRARNTTSTVASGVTSVASDAIMARRASESDEVDVVITEDPLRVQNRRLSALVAVLGVIVVVALLWATDPSRNGGDDRPVGAVDAVPAALLNEDDAATPEPTQDVASIAGIGTPIPTATQVPVALRQGGTIAYTVRERGQTDLWLVGIGSDNPIRITNDPTDERDPAWDPSGQRLAFASRRDGNWELYVYDMPTQEIERITLDLSFQAGPVWSPDGLYLAYESYQGDNLNIFAQRVDGSEPPIPITQHPSPDYSPAWSPSPGRQIAFVSLRDGNQDIYVVDLNTSEATNLTNTPAINEDYPAWSPDGRYIAYSAVDAGREKVFVKAVDAPQEAPRVIALGRRPSWAPDGASLIFAVDSTDETQSYLYAVPFGRDGGVATEVVSVPYGATSPNWSSQPIPPRLVNSGGLNLGVLDPLYVEQVERSNNPNRAPVGLQTLLDVQTQQAFLSDAVNDSFNALRQEVLDRAGWDFLGQLDDAWWEIDRLPSPGQEARNWHKTGRAFSIARNRILGFPPPMEIVREDTDLETYWRVFVRVDEDLQSGELGEPLRRLPWDFTARTSGDIEAYNQGGRLKNEVPAGYYIDLTQLAQDYGWEQRPAGSDWRANSETIYYWQFIKPEGLDWYEAMLEMYLPSQLGGFNPTATPEPVVDSEQS